MGRIYKNRLALICTALLAAMCSSEDEIPPVKAALKVMSFNIRMTTEADTGDLSWESRRESCVRMIRDVRPGVIGMQEPRPEQRTYLSEALPEYGQFYIAEDENHPENQCGHMSLFYLTSEYTLLDRGYFWLSETPDVPSMPWNTTDGNYRTTLWVHLKENVTQKEFYFFTTHLPYKAENDEPRLLCARLNVAKMKEIAGRGMPVFIAGDMNASYATDDKRRSCLNPYYEWMWSGRDAAPDSDREYSFNNFGLSEAKSTWNYDHIFYRRVTPVQFRTITCADYGVRFVSDHYPIVLTAEF